MSKVDTLDLTKKTKAVEECAWMDNIAKKLIKLNSISIMSAILTTAFKRSAFHQHQAITTSLIKIQLLFQNIIS